MQIFSLMCQSVDLDFNVGYVSAYICGGHKNNLQLQFCSSFKKIVNYSIKAVSGIMIAKIEKVKILKEAKKPMKYRQNKYF